MISNYRLQAVYILMQNFVIISTAVLFRIILRFVQLNFPFLLDRLFFVNFE